MPVPAHPCRKLLPRSCPETRGGAESWTRGVGMRGAFGLLEHRWGAGVVQPGIIFLQIPGGGSSPRAFSKGGSIRKKENGRKGGGAGESREQVRPR